MDDLLEDRLFPLGGEDDFGGLALHPFLEEAALLKIVDVHIFEADGGAVIGLEYGHDLAQGG